MNPNDAVSLMKAHSMILANKQFRGQLQRLAEAGHDAIGLTANEIIRGIAAKNRPAYLKIKSRPLSLRHQGTKRLNKTATVLQQIARKENSTAAVRKKATQRLRSINPKDSHDTRLEHIALTAISNATNAQLENAFRTLGIERVQISQPTKMAMSPQVKTLLLKVLRGIPINTTQELREHFVKTLVNAEEIMEYGRMDKITLAKALVNHGVIPPERRTK